MPGWTSPDDINTLVQDLQSRVRRLETYLASPALGASFQLLGSSTGTQGTLSFTSSWATLSLGGNLSFTLPALSQQVNTRNILILGHMTFGAFNVINSISCQVRLGVAGSYGGAYVTPNSGNNPSDVGAQEAQAGLSSSSSLCSSAFWAVMNLNAGSYNAYYQYQFDSGSTTQILVAGTPSIAVFAFG